MSEDRLNTGRNMQHTCKCNRIESE